MNGEIEGEEESEEEIRIKTKRKDNKDNKWNRGRGENDREINGPVRREKEGSHEGTEEEKEGKMRNL